MQVPARISGAGMIGPAELASLADGAGLGGAAISLGRADGAEPVTIGDGAGIYPASMIKTPLAVAAALAVREGRLRFGDRVTVDTANMTFNDAPSPLAPGFTVTVAELIELMLERSDNVATNVLLDVLDRDRATRDIAGLGFPATAFRRKLSGALPLIDDPAASGRNTHPAREAAELFARIARGAVPSAALVLRSLLAQYWNAKLSAGLAPGDRFAHKTGDTDETSHDGGILELAGGGRFVLVVYTELPSTDETDTRFAEFMRALRPRLAAE